MYRPLYSSPWLWYFLPNSSEFFIQFRDTGVEEVNPAPLWSAGPAGVPPQTSSQVVLLITEFWRETSICPPLWLTKTWLVHGGSSHGQLNRRKGIIPPTHPKTTLWPGERKANKGTRETTLSRGRIRATLWVGAGRQIGGEREKNTA